MNALKFFSPRFLFWSIFFLGALIHLLHYPYALGPGNFTLVDEVDAYRWSWNLLYYSHAHFGTYLPGPWQNLLGYGLLKSFNGSTHGFYAFWLLLGTLQIPLTYWFVKKLADDKTALVSMLMAAILPYALRLTGNFWNPNFILPILTLALGFYLDVLKKEKSPSIAGFILFISLVPFFHMIPVLLLPGLALGLLYFKPRLHLGFLALGILGALIFWVPFLLLDWKNHFFILKGNADFGTSKSEFEWDTFKIFYHPVTTLTSDVSRFLGHDIRSTRFFFNRFYGSFTAGVVFHLPSIVLSLLIWVFYFADVFKNRLRDTDEKIKGFLFFLFASSAFLFLIKLKPHSDRYVILWWPLMMWIAGASLVSLWSWIQKRSSRNLKIIFSIFLLFALLQTTYNSIVLSIHERNAGTDHSVRMIHSLIVIEEIEEALKIKLGLGKTKGPIYHPTLLEGQKADHSLIPSDSTTNIYHRTLIYIDASDIEQKIEPWREERFLNELGIFWEYNGYLARVTDPTETKHRLLISHPSLDQKNRNAGWEKIGEVPSAHLWYRLLP